MRKILLSALKLGTPKVGQVFYLNRNFKEVMKFVIVGVKIMYGEMYYYLLPLNVNKQLYLYRETNESILLYYHPSKDRIEGLFEKVNPRSLVKDNDVIITESKMYIGFDNFMMSKCRYSYGFHKERARLDRHYNFCVKINIKRLNELDTNLFFKDETVKKSKCIFGKETYDTLLKKFKDVFPYTAACESNPIYDIMVCELIKKKMIKLSNRKA